MRILILILSILISSIAQARDTASLQSSDGTAISASNPLYVTCVGGNCGVGGSSQWLTVTNVGINTTDNVGIGSTVPTQKLDVNGTVKAVSFQSSSTSAGNIGIYEASANGSNSITVTVPSSISSDVTYTLPATVGTAGQVMTASDSSGGINWSSIVQGSGGSVNWASITGDQRTGNWTAISPYINTGAINWQSVYTVNQSVNWGTGFQQADSFNATGTGNTLLNTSSGNVGVGSSNPGAKLDVNGSLRVLGNFAGGTTGNVGIGTFGASAATCDSVCNSTNTRRCFHGMTSTGIPTGCAVSITGTCICLPQS